MKMKQLSLHVFKLETWVGIKISMWIVRDNGGITLIDTGLKFMRKKSQKKFAQKGNLQRILLTHGHPDHVGALNQILQSHEVPVYAHRDEHPYLQAEDPYPGRKKPNRVIELGTIRASPKTSQKHDLIPDLRPYHTPARARGHTRYHQEADDLLISGDLFTCQTGQLRRPMPKFTADMTTALASGKE